MNRFFIALMMTFFSASPNAAVVNVDSTTSAYYRFNLASVGTFNASYLEWVCIGVGCPGENNFASGASLQLDFGTTVGANDLGTRYFHNPLGSAVSGLRNQLQNAPGSGGSPLPLSLIAPLSEMFLTFSYLDDEFSINMAFLGQTSSPAGDIGGGMVEGPSAVPLPAAAWLFGSALLGLVVIKRNRV